MQRGTRVFQCVRSWLPALQVGSVQRAAASGCCRGLASAVPDRHRDIADSTHVQVSEERLQEFLRAEVSTFADMDAQSISLRQVLDASTPKRVASLALRELPVRFAHRIQQLEQLQDWQQSPDLREVHSIYSASFRDIRLVNVDLKAQNLDLQEFTDAIQILRRRMQGVIPRLASAMRFMQKRHGLDSSAIDLWLDIFLLSRIGTEMLTSQYLACVRATRTGNTDQPTIVDHGCDPASICEQAAKYARKLCREHFSADERITIKVESNCKDNNDKDRILFPYVPQYLYYITVELLKNSARATIEGAADPGQLLERPIVITVAADESQVAIRVQDRAGGIAFDDARRVWSYMYSTAKETRS